MFGQRDCQDCPTPYQRWRFQRSPGRGGDTKDYDDRSCGGDRGGREGNHNPGNQEASDTAPPTQSTHSGNSRGAVAPVGTTAQADNIAPVPVPVPSPAALVPASPTIPVTPPVGECFAANMANNPFAALATPSHVLDPNSPVLDPNTVSSSIPADTLDSDFSFAFAASQGIVTPSNHSKQSAIGYLCTACQVMLHPTNLSTTPEQCSSTIKSTVPHQISTAHLGMTDSGATHHFF
jgi:hypothetical protein